MPRLEGTGNVFFTPDMIAAEALRLLKNNLVAARYVHRNLERKFGSIGDTISIKLPARVKSASGRTLVKQPMVDQTTTLTVNRQEHVGLDYNMIDKTLAFDQFSERYLKPGIVQLAHKVDRSIYEEAINAAFYSSGTPGNAVASQAFNLAVAYMEMVGVPMDGLVKAFVNPLDRAGVEADLKTVFNEKMVDMVIRRTFMGDLAGCGLYSTAQIPVMSIGSHGGTPLTNGADQTGASLVTDGWTASTTVLKKGNIFTIEGVYEVNPQTYESTGRLQRFTCTADVTSDGTGAATIPISPSINDGTNTTLDKEGNSISLKAFQNVTAAPADGAAITVIGTADTTYRVAPMWHRDAIALAVVDIELPQSAGVKARARDEDSGLSICMTADYNITDMTEVYRLDVLWGVKAVYPELLHLVFSDENAN